MAGIFAGYTFLKHPLHTVLRSDKAVITCLNLFSVFLWLATKMSLETNDLPVICFENTKSVTKQLEIVFKCSENLIGAAITLNHTL